MRSGSERVPKGMPPAFGRVHAPTEGPAPVPGGRVPAGTNASEPGSDRGVDGALFGWHADPDRLVRLYWQALGEEQHAAATRSAARTLAPNPVAPVRPGALPHQAVVGVLDRLDRLGNELEAAVLRPDPAQDPQAPAPGEPAEGEDFSLQLATAALVNGDDRLARLLYSYSLLARRDRSRLPALLDAAAAAVDRLTEGPGEASRD